MQTEYSKAWDAYKQSGDYETSVRVMQKAGMVQPYIDNILQLSFNEGYNNEKHSELKTGVTKGFQQKVNSWMLLCFGASIANDQVERNHRFLEEALELVQSLGCTASEAHQLVDYVFNRPVGEPHQECGGVMVTLAALSTAVKLDMSLCGELELLRVHEKTEQIRAKQAAKPKHSPLPQ